MNVNYKRRGSRLSLTVTLTGTEVAQAILDYCAAHGLNITGPRTVRVNGELCTQGNITVDPLGKVAFAGVIYPGNIKASESHYPFTTQHTVGLSLD